MVCSICLSRKHNRTTCEYNSEILSTRPGKRRRRCKRICTKDLRKFRKLKIFDRNADFFAQRKQKASQSALKRAKLKVCTILDRLELEVYRDKISPFEKAWFEASGENKLNFDFGGMREDVNNAVYGIKDLSKDDLAHNDGLQIYINKHYPCSQGELEQILMHECLHHNITRATKGMTGLSDDIEHLAMALLGDRDELSNMRLGWFDCVFGPDCPNPTHWLD